jgi:hypothetical protein
VSQRTQLTQDVFRIDEPAHPDVFLRGGQGTVQGGTIFRVEPVSGIEGQEIHLGPLGESGGLIDRQTAVVDAGFESHEERIAPHAGNDRNRDQDERCSILILPLLRR